MALDPNPTIKAQQYTQESCDNEKPESTPKDFMNYREIRCENDCVKKMKANQQKNISIVKESCFSPF